MSNKLALLFHRKPETIRQDYLRPLLALKHIVMTIPDKPRSSLQVCRLGLIFLKYIAGNRAEHRAKLMKGKGDYTGASEGEKTHCSVDLLGRVHEYFLTRFASVEGKNGGQFYTPSCVVRCLVEMLAPYKGRMLAWRTEFRFQT